MSRIAELQEKYPSIHKDIIVKWELETNGIRDTKDLDKVSEWRSASDGLYLSVDEDLTLDRLKRETPWRVRDNAVLMPGRLLMRTGFGFSLYRKERSPYTIREISEGEMGLFDGEEMVDVELLYPPPRKKQQRPEWVTSKGTPIRDLVELSGPMYRIYPVRFCEYFNSGEECKFCNYNQTQDDGRAIGMKRPVTINAEEAAEAVKIYGSEVKLRDGTIVGGGFKKSETEASVTLKFVEAVNKALPYKTQLGTAAQAMPRRELQRLKDAGLTTVRFQMETFDERLFPLINPGKAESLSRDGWLEAFQNAVDLFGAGNVAAKFVGGVTLQGPHGYRTWQEARDSHMEGDRWMIGHGVFPCMCTLRWAPGSPFSRDPANRDKFAPTEYYLDLALAHHAAMLEYDLYEKVNRWLYGGLSGSTTIYIGDIGIIELYGDMGKWMSAAVPYQENWIARYLAGEDPEGESC